MYRPDDQFRLDGTELPRPSNLYGVSKAAGETLGRYYHDHHDISVVNVRIGNLTQHHPPKEYERGQAMWLSYRDCGHLFECCIEADYDYEIVYGISDNDRKYYSIDRARAVLGYDPQDNSAEFTFEGEPLDEPDREPSPTHRARYPAVDSHRTPRGRPRRRLAPSSTTAAGRARARTRTASRRTASCRCLQVHSGRGQRVGDDRPVVPASLRQHLGGDDRGVEIQRAVADGFAVMCQRRRVRRCVVGVSRVAARNDRTSSSATP